MAKTYEIRDPIYGLIKFSEWEREIINHEAFQRLRRIRQLGLTDMVYPGAMHTRFEHSIGVMHIAAKIFENICEKKADYLKSEFSLKESGLQRDKVLIRLSSLLHDIGHAPFSHASEKLMGKDSDEKSYKHEDYSSAVIEYLMKDVIEDFPENRNLISKPAKLLSF